MTTNGTVKKELKLDLPDDNNKSIYLKSHEASLKCFICHLNENIIKCSHKKCDKYYHRTCLNTFSYPVSIKSDVSFICPLHYCLSCYIDQPYPRKLNCSRTTKKQLVTCSNCPTAFHFDESCMAAGTVLLENDQVICPAHRTTKNEKHINVNWCFCCSGDGNLICCETCPAAFHMKCIDNPSDVQNDQYICSDCQSRKQLHYGDIIWIKLGRYRWWPARITNPDVIPSNIMRLNHSDGDFPIYFFGSHDYNWSHKGRVFLFVEEDGIKGFGNAFSNKKFKKACQEAREAFMDRKEIEDKRLQKIINSEKPKFTIIKSNRPINNVQQSSADDEVFETSRCECKPSGEILCGTDECLNRVMMVECNPNTCPVYENCKNQRFKRRQYPKCVPFKTKDAGWGLKTLQDIKKGDFVIEYVGELINEAECNRRMDQKYDRGDTFFYFLTIDKDRIIDAEPAANHARFINHSCQPNCMTQKWVVGGQTKVGIFAIYDISEGTELTFNYNLDCRGNERMECKCNSQNCSGYIGLPVKNAKASNT